MLRVIVAVAALSVGLTSATQVAGQQFLTKESVVSECALVASAENGRKADHSEQTFSGRCIGATSGYLATLAAAQLPPDEFGADISALVVDLVQLLRDKCVVNSEVAQAIAVASSASTDKDQQAQIKLVSVTVADCDFGATASIRAPFDFGNTSRSSGRPASFS